MDAIEHPHQNEVLVSKTYVCIIASIAPILLTCVSLLYGLSVFTLSISVVVFFALISFFYDDRGIFDALMFSCVCGALYYGAYKQLGPFVTSILTVTSVVYFFLINNNWKEGCSLLFVIGHGLIILFIASLIFVVPPHMLIYPKHSAEVRYNETLRWMISPFSYRGKLEYAPPLTGKVIIKDTQSDNVITDIEVTYSVALKLVNSDERWTMLRTLEIKGFSLSSTLQPGKTIESALQDSLKNAYPFINFRVKRK